MNVSKNLCDYPPNGAKQEQSLKICERCRLVEQVIVVLEKIAGRGGGKSDGEVPDWVQSKDLSKDKLV